MRAQFAEQQIIASCLVYEERMLQVLESLDDSDFSGREREHFTAIKAAYEKYGFEGMGDNAGIEIQDFSNYMDIAIKHIDENISKVKEMTSRRKLQNVVTELMVEIREGDPQEGALKAIEEISNIVNESSTSKEQTMSEVMQDAVKVIDRVRAGESFGLRSGLDIDKKIGGFQNGQFYLIAARPSMGKTALALQIAASMSKEVPGAFLSLETTNSNIGMRHIVREAMIDAETLREGKINDDEYQKILDYAGRLSELNLITDDTMDVTAGGIFTKANYLKRKYGIGFLMVDYVQLMQAKAESRERQIAEVSMACRAASKQLDIPIIGLAQLSRKPEERTNKEPMLSDLRESGQLEQDAFCVMFLYRPEYYGVQTYEDGSSTEGICEAIIAKNKDGATGKMKLQFDKRHMKFNNLVHDPTPF